MRIWVCISALALAASQDQCDLQQLNKPKFSLHWACDKPIENDKVPIKTNCEIICPNGYDLFNGRSTEF